jgi:hypothetical protein
MGFKSPDLMIIHPTLPSIILTNSFRKTTALRQSLRLIYAGMFNPCGCTKSLAKVSQMLRFKLESGAVPQTVKENDHSRAERRLSAQICPPERVSLKKKLELKRKQTEGTQPIVSTEDLPPLLTSWSPGSLGESRAFPFLSLMLDSRRKK